jgi:radial spoke head protein 4A
MSQVTTFEQAKAYLQKKYGNSSVYDHLTELLLKLVVEKPEDSVAMFEHLSSVVKQSSFPGSASGKTSDGSVDKKALSEAQLEWTSQSEALFKGAPEPAEGVEPAPVQDFTDQSNYLEWAGVGLGREESFRVHMALKHLAAAKPVRNLRFWGKLLGTAGDYIVAEGEMDAEDEEEDALDSMGNTIEKTGEGANKFAYFVCSYPGAPWTQLPNVTPDQIVIARQIRRFFTGSLDAAVGGHPPFPGREAGYLRAVIALITSATVVSPAGVFATGEEEEDALNIVRNEEEFDAPDLTQMGSWVHHVLPLNKLGRCTPNPPKLDEEGEPIADDDAPDAPEPLKSIEEDGDEENPVWGLRVCPVSGQGEEPDENALVVAKSASWPGAVSVGFGKQFVNAYVGYGLPYASAAYEPAVPGAVLSEVSLRPVGGEDEEEEGVAIVEQADVTTDPNEGKEAGEEDEEEED